MLIDEQGTREMLSRIAFRLSNDPSFRQDLLQEAMVHLWLLEERRPGQTQSWYFQSCKFHLQNYLTTGRSIDSLKRASGAVIPDTEASFDEFLPSHDGDSELVGFVSARDIFRRLAERLGSFELKLLELLAQGHGAREIAGQLGVTHPTVIKYRRRIAAQALRMGIPPMLRARAAAALG